MQSIFSNSCIIKVVDLFELLNLGSKMSSIGVRSYELSPLEVYSSCSLLCCVAAHISLPLFCFIAAACGANVDVVLFPNSLSNEEPTSLLIARYNL